MNADIKHVLFNSQDINEKIQFLASRIDLEYGDKDELCVLALLDGSFIFAADLVRALQTPVHIEFVRAKSYKGTESTGAVSIDEHFDSSIFRNKHVLIVDDILDTGLTLSTVRKIIINSEALSVSTCVLLDKQTEKRLDNFQADFVCLNVPDEFVVGYGLDYNGQYRDFPYIGVLDEKIYNG
jgi:hypoxanthine phosphoribosyltransferase